MEDVFTFNNGFLFCERVRIKDLCEELTERGIFPPSPCFVYSRSKLLSNIKTYQVALQTLRVPSVVSYSMKANFTPGLLQIIRSQGCSVTLVSGMELKLALSMGFPSHLMVFNGNGKQDWERTMAITTGCLINVDSHFDLKQTLRICHNLNRRANIMLRLNLDIDPEVHPYINTGLATSKFGINAENLETCISLLESCDTNLDLVGLHCHLGSTINKIDAFRLCTLELLKLRNMLKRRGFNNIKYINIGGGLGIDYRNLAERTLPPNPADSSAALYTDEAHGNERIPVQTRTCHSALQETHEPKETEVYQIEKIPTATDLVSSIQSVLNDPDVFLIVEPGRSIIGNTAILATTVLGTKHNGNKKFIVIDGAMTEVLRPSLYGAYHHIELTEPSRERTHVEGNEGSGSETERGEVSCLNGSNCQLKTQTSSEIQSFLFSERSLEQENKHIYDIVGPVCESTDVLGKDRLLPEPHQGCGLAVFDVGAYCSSMSSNYNMRLRPCEVLVDGDSWRLIRSPDTFDDLLRPYGDLDMAC